MDEQQKREDHRAFRESDPPGPQLVAVGARLGLGEVHEVVRLTGGLETATHRVTYAAGEVVLRRFSEARGWHPPEHVTQEAETLRLLDATAVPAPRLLAVDVDGSEFGCPMLVVSVLEGQTMAPPATGETTMGRLVDAMLEVHALPCDVQPGPWRSEWLQPDRPDRFDAVPLADEVWEAVLLTRDELLAEPEGLIHHDLHPGNTLWHDGRLTGIVDWGDAARGRGGHDLAYCALDLVLSLGPGADRGLRDAWARATGQPVHPGWLAVAALALMEVLPQLVPAYAELAMPTDADQLAARMADWVGSLRMELGLPG